MDNPKDATRKLLELINEFGGFPGGLGQRISLTMQETQEMLVWPLGGEDLPEEEMATCSSILAWKIPWTKESCGL